MINALQQKRNYFRVAYNLIDINVLHIVLKIWAKCYLYFFTAVFCKKVARSSACLFWHCGEFYVVEMVCREKYIELHICIFFVNLNT